MYTGDGKCTPFINPEWLEFKLGYEFTRNAVRISKQTEQLYNTKKNQAIQMKNYDFQKFNCQQVIQMKIKHQQNY